MAEGTGERKDSGKEGRQQQKEPGRNTPPPAHSDGRTDRPASPPPRRRAAPKRRREDDGGRNRGEKGFGKRRAAAAEGTGEKYSAARTFRRAGGPPRIPSPQRRAAPKRRTEGERHAPPEYAAPEPCSSRGSSRGSDMGRPRGGQDMGHQGRRVHKKKSDNRFIRLSPRAVSETGSCRSTRLRLRFSRRRPGRPHRRYPARCRLAKSAPRRRPRPRWWSSDAACSSRRSRRPARWR